MLWSLWHKYISRFCSVNVILLLFFAWEMTITEERTSPLSLPSCLCSVPGFSPGAHLPPQPCRHTHTGHTGSKVTDRDTGECHLHLHHLWPVLQSHFSSWNIHKASLPHSTPPHKTPKTHLVAKRSRVTANSGL